MGVVCSVVLGAFAARIGSDIVLAPFCLFGLSLVAISFVDIERYVIPKRIVYPTLAVIVPFLVLSSAVDDRWDSLERAGMAGAFAFLAFLALHLALPRGMGYGDVRLAGLIGLTIGWLGVGHAFVAFSASFLLGALFGVTVMVVSGQGRKTRIPFGPFLAAGAVFSVIWGNPIAGALFHRP
jgi:leader peptidase (prepilin peptidase) / N-methyltransferase